MRMTTKQAARGKWDGILTELIGESAVTRKHGPCPICGGTDRYRYDNKRNDGDWYCNVCGPGDGFRLLSESLGLSFAEVAKRVDRIVNNIEEKPFKPIIDTEKRRKNLNRVWLEANEPQIVVDYLRSRDIKEHIIEEVRDLRGHPSLPYFDGKKKIGEYPAMVALIRNSKGEPLSIHRTYITGQNTSKDRKKIMPPIQPIVGGAVRLGEPGAVGRDALGFAEGIETALAFWQLTEVPCWATISAHGMEKIESIPRHVKRVLVAADYDDSFVGQRAAFTMAANAKRKWQVPVEVWMPKQAAFDMNDVVQVGAGCHVFKESYEQ